MIDVLKRLAELDAKNPNMISENTEVEECGPMGSMGLMGETTPAEAPKSPATLNVTAGSAEELGNMLTQIMQLAGVHKVDPAELGIQTEPEVAIAEPEGSEEPHSGSPDSMRSVLDKMNDMDGEEGGEDDKEETDESEEPDQHGIPGVDTTPNNPTKQMPFNANRFANHENQPGGGDVPKDHESRPRDRNQPTATMEQQLMREYQDFLNESNK